MREREEESRPGLLPFGEVGDFRPGVEGERLPQLVRVPVVPRGIECTRVANELFNAQPAWEVVFLGEITDPRQDADRIGDGIEAEDAHRTAFRPEQTQQVFDERRLARTVCADEAVDSSAWHGQGYRGQGRRGAEAACQLRHADDRFTHPRATAYALRCVVVIARTLAMQAER